MTTQTTALTAAGVTNAFTLAPGQSLTYSSSGTFTGDARFVRSRTQGAAWGIIEHPAVDTNFTGATLKNETKAEERYRVELYDDYTDPENPIVVSGTLTVVVADVNDVLSEVHAPDGTLLERKTDQGYTTFVRPSRLLAVNAAGQAKAGATAGWVVAAGDNIGLVTCPASKTGSTLVVPVPSLNVGDTITGFYLVGQVENTAAAALTIDADLRKHTAAAADVADASVGAITQFTVAVDAILSSANTRKVLAAEEVVGVDETFYVLITATTGASVDIALQGVVLEITEA